MAKRRALGPSTAFELGDGDGVCRPGIVWECTAVLRIVFDQVEEDSTAADAVLRPIYTVAVSDCVDVRGFGRGAVRTVDAQLDDLGIDIHRV